jgi:hypothetical protein
LKVDWVTQKCGVPYKEKKLSSASTATKSSNFLSS